MHSLEQVFVLLVTVIALCGALEVNISKCVKDCKEKQEKAYAKMEGKTPFKKYPVFCNMTCAQEHLGSLVEKANNSESALPRPETPSLVKASWQTIKVRFNTTELKNHTDLHYILEVKPLWGPQARGQKFVVFPYTKIYHITNHTTYTIEDLEPNSRYKFRVIALKHNRSSTFSDWSSVMNTTDHCAEPPCGVTNIRLELTTEIPYKKEAYLKSLFRWKPSTSFSEINKTQLNNVIQNIVGINECRRRFDDNKPFFSKTNTLPGLDALIKKEKANLTIEGKEPEDHLYYDCWYELEMEAVDNAQVTTRSAAKRRCFFHIPNCIQITNTSVCGCTYKFAGDKPVNDRMNRTFERTSNNTATGYFTWTDELWRNERILAHHLLVIYHKVADWPIIFKEYYNVTSNVSYYNATVHNLTIGEKFHIFIIGLADHHCENEQRHSNSFVVAFPCENNPCSENSSCHPVGDGKKHECRCNRGFEKRDEKCIDENPCETNPCGKNAECKPIPKTGERNCTCKKDFWRINGTCRDICEVKRCPEKEKCIRIPATKDRNCTCEANLVKINGICKLSKNRARENENGATSTGTTLIIVVAVLTPLAVILTAIVFVVWLRRSHKKQMNFMKNEFETAMEIIPNRNVINVRSIDLDMLGDDVNGKEMNLLYVSQDNIYEIPEYILESISRYELPPDSVTFRGMIGKGAFGRVYAGEARGINGNPELTAVAIKTLKESANEEEFSNFLREIDLMKDLGTHENVINMYGCCTNTRPIYLVLEYAPGGNLLNHLRALKKKCKDIVAAQSEGAMNSTNVDAQDFNAEISMRIKEEIRAALDSKELESFSHQIAAGMKHISGHGIVHRDLAARNILIGKDKILKISDFGLSREGVYVQKRGGKIPFRWLAIEAIQERSYSTASDVWAFGVVLWEICTLGEIPYSGVSDRELRDFLLDGNRLEKVENCTDAIYKIMSKCWGHLPTDRPTFEELYDELWQLPTKGNIYVNIEGLMKQSLKKEDRVNAGETSKNNNSIDEER